jgi:predicted Zn-dependent protease
MRPPLRNALTWLAMAALLGCAALTGVEHDARAARAIAYYRQSLARRPSWPYAWADLAEALARFGQTGEAFQQAFAQALRSGPWEQDVQLTIAKAGFRAFKQLSRENRAAFARAIQHAASAQAQALLPIAREADSLWLVCVLAAEQPAVKRACQAR